MRCVVLYFAVLCSVVLYYTVLCCAVTSGIHQYDTSNEHIRLLLHCSG